FPGMEVRSEELMADVSKFDLTLSFVEQNGKLSGRVEYATDLFDGVRIEQIIGHLQHILEGMVHNSDALLADLPMLSEAEREQVVRQWNQYPAPNGLKNWLTEMVEEQAQQARDRVAAVIEGQHVGYGELNQRANQLAHCLRGLGVGPEVLVGIAL